MTRQRSKLPAIVIVLVAMLASFAQVKGQPRQQAARPECAAGKSIHLKGHLPVEKLNSYKLLPFKVAKGVNSLTVTYSYTEGDTVLDLGIWDNDGAFAYDGFRGWSGSRQGRSDDTDDDGEPDQPPIVIQPGDASRNFNPAPVRPGIWKIELGVGFIEEGGADYDVKVKCRKTDLVPKPVPDPVDPTHVASAEPGWYYGDFHMHAFHSNLNAPTQEEFVQFARDAQLDFMPITEYQINRHWNEWGATVRANPDLIFWPGREVITYFGHAGVIGETPGMIDYRHGFKDVSMADIQAAVVERGALFQINHPTTFPAPFDYLCRGCVWELDDVIDYSKVHAIEVVNTGVQTSDGVPNPFVETAVDFWVDKLLSGYHIAPTGGSDDKLGPNYGIPATAVFAESLSRDALKAAVDAGHVWIAARGVEAGPEIGFGATAGEETAIFGDTLASDTAEFTVTVKRGLGDVLSIYRNDELQSSVPVTSDDFTHTFTGTAVETENPLGTYYRIETRDGPDAPVPGLLTTLGMPIFLKAP